MAGSKRLIIGLGNPGPEYEGTRHNIGFTVIDAISEKTRIKLQERGSYHTHGWGRYRGREMGLAKPTTFMNRSGLAVLDLVRRQGTALSEFLVIVDDVNLPVGSVRLREGGSAGGHNGLQDIIERIGSDGFPRLRFGIGSDFERGGQADYVLSRFSQEEQETVERAVVRARDAAIIFVTDGIVTAMNRFNQKVP